MTPSPTPSPARPPRPRPTGRPIGRIRRLAAVARGPSGQATAEYALVLLAAAGLAGLLLAWATSTDAIGRLMDAVLDSLIGDVAGAGP